MPVMLSDIPNHDGLSSVYFDQNMITSGRWFLTIACGFSSYFTIPWLIGLLGMVYLGVAAAALTELLELKDKLMKENGSFAGEMPASLAASATPLKSGKLAEATDALMVLG